MNVIKRYVMLTIDLLVIIVLFFFPFIMGLLGYIPVGSAIVINLVWMFLFISCIVSCAVIKSNP